MRIKVIGKGFIGSHLIEGLKDHTIVEDDPDFIFYCAGISHRSSSEDFYEVNYENVKECIKNTNAPFVYISSIHYDRDDDYGRSKRLGESATLEYDKGIVYRLQNTFGRNAKPNHHSVVATWLYNIKHDLPIIVNDENAWLELNYIDDVVKGLVQALELNFEERIRTIKPIYKTQLKDLLKIIKEIKKEIKQETDLGKLLEEVYKSY